MAVPIWKDFDVTLGTASANPDGVPYRIINSLSTVIFTGKAYARPGAVNVVTRINDIIAPYLVPAFELTGANTNTITITVQAYDVEDGWLDVTGATNVVFYNDWSYASSGAYMLKAPIVRKVSPLQYLPLASDDGVFNYAVDGGFYEETKTGFATYWLNLPAFTPASAVVDASGPNSITYAVTDCIRYVLYYVNAFGTWEHLVIEGRTDVSEGVTRHTYETEYNNGTPASRGTWDNVNELERRYVFRTGMLTMEQSNLMHHVLNSPLVYVHDLEAGEIRPIIITNSTTEFKSSPKLYQYTIEASLAQQRIRR